MGRGRCSALATEARPCNLDEMHLMMEAKCSKPGKASRPVLPMEGWEYKNGLIEEKVCVLLVAEKILRSSTTSRTN